jgi:hypothetical protein
MRLFDHHSGHESSLGWDPDAFRLGRTRESVELRIPVEGNGGPCGWLVVSYRRSDPLAVLFRVCALDGRSIIDRVELRRDVKGALEQPGCLPGLSVGPASERGFTALVFQEGGVTLPVIVPTEPLREMIRVTESVIAMDDLAETAALNDAFRESSSAR